MYVLWFNSQSIFHKPYPRKNGTYCTRYFIEINCRCNLGWLHSVSTRLYLIVLVFGSWLAVICSQFVTCCELCICTSICYWCEGCSMQYFVVNLHQCLVSFLTVRRPLLLFSMRIVTLCFLTRDIRQCSQLLSSWGSLQFLISLYRLSRIVSLCCSERVVNGVTPDRPHTIVWVCNMLIAWVICILYIRTL